MHCLLAMFVFLHVMLAYLLLGAMLEFAFHARYASVCLPPMLFFSACHCFLCLLAMLVLPCMLMFSRDALFARHVCVFDCHDCICLVAIFVLARHAYFGSPYLCLRARLLFAYHAWVFLSWLLVLAPHACICLDAILVLACHACVAMHACDTSFARHACVLAYHAA